MQKMIEFKRPDYCIHCETERAIEGYDKFGKPINYTYLIDQKQLGKEVSDKLDRREVTFMKCRKCNHEFFIDWRTKDNIPKPINSFVPIDYFLISNYKY